MIRRPVCAVAFALAPMLLGAPTLAQEEGAAESGAALGELTPQEQLEALLKQGQEQFESGDFDASAQTFTTVVNAFERAGAYAPGPLLFRAKAYANLEEYAAALEDLKKAIQYAQQQPGVLPEVQNTRAEVYLKLEAYQEAYADLQAATQADRSNPQYQFNFGKALVKLGGAEEGTKALTKYLDATAESDDAGESSQRAEALRLRSQAYGALRKFAEAEADVAASLAIDPDNYEAFFTRAQIALADKRYRNAAESLERAIATYEPKDESDTLPFVQGMLTRASALEELGKELTRTGDSAGAADAYRACVGQCEETLGALDDSDPRTGQIRVATLFRRGVAERLLGDFGAAVKSFSLAIETDPTLGDAYFRRGVCFHYLGEDRLAILDFEQAASIDFDSPRANLWKGMAFAKAGDLQEAIRAYGESIAVSDRYTPAYVNRGLAYLSAGDFDKAVADFNEAIRLQPTEPLHYFRRARAQSQAGERDRAIQSYINAIEFDERFAPAYQAVVAELDASGQSALAGEYRRRAAQLGL